jgi:hypothetical protein
MIGVIIAVAIPATFYFGQWLSRRNGWSDIKGKLVSFGVFVAVLCGGLVLLALVGNALGL